MQIITVVGPIHTVTNTYEPNRAVLATKQNRVTTGPNTNAIVSQYDYTVNALGQRTTRTQTGTAFTTANTDNFTYNPRSEVVNSTNNLASTLNRSYSYDPIGNRLAATEGDINNPATNPTTQTHTWGLDLSNTLQSAAGVGGLLSIKFVNSEISQFYIHTYDGNGNTSELIKPTGGASAHYQYDPFGKEIISIGSVASLNTYRFSTKPLDSIVGLNYYGYRFYLSETGTWLNRDPMEERGGVNLYLFSRNNALSAYDVLGQNTFDGSFWSAFVYYQFSIDYDCYSVKLLDFVLTAYSVILLFGFEFTTNAYLENILSMDDADNACCFNKGLDGVIRQKIFTLRYRTRKRVVLGLGIGNVGIGGPVSAWLDHDMDRRTFTTPAMCCKKE